MRACVYLDEGLVVQCGVSLLKSYTLLLVLLQSQRVDGEQRHVGLGGGKEHLTLCNTGIGTTQWTTDK